MFWTRLGHGLAAGAAGVTMLNAITYLDMAVRARPSSDTPSQAVEQLAGKAGAEIPGEGGARENRLAGLGPLAGIATGAAVGVTAALTWPRWPGSPRRSPRPCWARWPWPDPTARWSHSA